MRIEDCLTALVIACNDQLVYSDAGPRLIAKMDKFKKRAKKHKHRCGSHCWVLTGLRDMESVRISGNIVRDPTSDNFSFSLTSTRLVIRQAIRVADGINIFHERRQRCPYLPGWQGPDLPSGFGVAAVVNPAVLDYYRRYGDEGYGTDNGDSDNELY